VRGPRICAPAQRRRRGGLRGAAEGRRQGPHQDPDDDYIAGVAYQGHADVIVSGDKDLLDLPDRDIKDAMDGVLARILSPREFLEELRTVE
jgi:predicted nucleic acid-binding protein